MKLSGILLLILAFLLNGCFSGKEHSDGLNTSELLKMEEERQMKELSRTGTLRLGVSAKNQKNIAALHSQNRYIGIVFSFGKFSYSRNSS